MGPVSLYHTGSGIALVRVLISLAMGDMVSAGTCAMEYTRLASLETAEIDISLGQTGTLLGAAILLDAMPEHPLLERGPVRELGARRAAALVEHVAALPLGGGAGSPLPFLGIAHGWAGVLYGLLRWSELTGEPIPAIVQERMDALLGCGEPIRQGLRWPRKIRSHARAPVYLASWCNGSAGFVFLWSLAYRLTGEARFVEAAVRTGHDVWDFDGGDYASLCCGLAGRIHALLELHRITGDSRWLPRAQRLARRATADPSVRARPLSLYKGALGVALTLAEIEDPAFAAMPLFGHLRLAPERERSAPMRRDGP